MIAKDAKTCPNCGAKNKKPVYRRWWFGILLLLVIVIAAGTISDKVKEKKDEERYKETMEELEDLSAMQELLEETESEITEESIVEEESEEDIVQETVDTEESENRIDGMRPEFKEAMDSYEAFFDEYCEFMKAYDAGSTDLKLLAEYTDFMQQAAEVSADFAKWQEEESMNEAEILYYAQVNARVSEKLAEAAISLQ